MNKFSLLQICYDSNYIPCYNISNMYHDPLHVAFIRTNQWMQAVELQVNRVIGPTLDPKIVAEVTYRNHRNQKRRDIDYFVIALYRLRRGLESENKFLRSINIEKAIKIFDTNIPDLKDLRDIGKHFTDYDWGRGKLEKKLTNESPTYSWGIHDGGISYRGKRLTLIQSRDAPRNLHQAVMVVLAKSGKKDE